MKAEFNNLLGNIAIGEDITDELKQVGETVATFLTGNLIPMIGNVLASIPDLLGKDFAAARLNMIAENSDQILESGVSFVTSLVKGIITARPYLAEAALNLVASFANAAFMDAKDPDSVVAASFAVVPVIPSSPCIT